MRRPCARPAGDRGAALLTVLMVITAITGLVATVAVAATQSVRSARSDTAATAALGQSEAGVAQAQQYLRTTGAVRAVNACGVLPAPLPTTTSATCTTPWATSSGVSVSTAAGVVERVTVQAVTPFSPPTTREGVYRITSVGRSAGSAVRTVQVDVRVAPHPFPFGVYAQDSISQGGGLSTANISLFSGRCINKRQQITFSGTDGFYGKPAAAHAVGWITTSGNGCAKADTGNIHRPAVGPCNTTYPNDQDELGSNSPGSLCPGHKLRVSGCSFTGAPTSRFTPEDLACYTVNGRGLPPQAYEELKQLARAQGTYFTSPNSFTLPAVMPAEGVIYFDLRNNTQKAVSLSAISGYETSTCGSRSVIIVVENGSAVYTGNNSLVGSIFVPDGTLRFNGAAAVIGTVFAKNLDMGAGNAQIGLQPCYTQNPPSRLMTLTPLSFSQLDR